MNAEDLARFGEFVQAVRERRELDVAELREAGRLLSEVARAGADLADYVRAEATALPKRNVLHDDTGDDPEARVAEVRHRMELIADLLRKSELHARRSHAALGHIDVRMNPDVDENQATIP